MTKLKIVAAWRFSIPGLSLSSGHAEFVYLRLMRRPKIIFRQMRIITWNCNMAFRKKADFVLTYKPDILIVPECEYPENLVFPIKTPKQTND